MKKLYLAQIPNGDPIQQDLYNPNGAILVQKGKTMTPKLRQQLLRNNIEYFFLDVTGYEEVAAHYEYFDEATIKQIEEVKKVYTASFRNLSDEFERIKKTGRFEKKVMEETACELVENIGRYQQVYLGLEGIRRKDFYTYIHSVDVAVFMVILSKSLGLTKEQQEQATLAGLLHDIGKTKIHASILQKPGPLTGDEMRIMQEHSRMGYRMLKNELNYAEETAVVSLEHHERMDATGYPRGIPWQHLHLYSKMAAVCDIYDAVTGERVYKKAMLPHEAVEFLMTIVDTHVDRSLTTLFVRNIAVYPLGTKVTLSNGDEGIVVRLHDGYPTRPVVKIGGNAILRDLMVEQTLFISQINHKNDENSC